MGLTRERKTLIFVIVFIFFVIFHVMEDRNKSHSRRSVQDYYDDQQVVYEDAELYNDIVNSPRLHSSHVKSSASNSQSVLPNRVNLTPKDATWQTVPGTRFKFYIYSAHYDNRNSPVIRVVGASKTTSTEKVYCVFWYSDESSKIVTAKTKVISENWNMEYSAIFLLCPVDYNVTLPASLSIVHKLELPIRNLLIVRNNQQGRHKVDYNGKKERDTMIVCVKPTHSSYDKVIQMFEFLELNKLLGADHVNFYISSVSDSIQCVLDQYRSQSESQQDPYVSTYEWNLNMVSKKEIRTEGLFAALNDCLYRNMYLYRYIMFVDLDEFIVPRCNGTLMDLIPWLGKHRCSTHSIGSYSFQNAFFYLQWPDDECIGSGNQMERHLNTVTKTRRRLKLHPHMERSKFIVRPEHVVEVGNHFVWEFIPGYGSLNIPQTAGILHHYRMCESGGNDCTKQRFVEDRTAHRYRSQLVTNVEAAYNRSKDKCGLILSDTDRSKASGHSTLSDTDRSNACVDLKLSDSDWSNACADLLLSDPAGPKCK